jgi:hypothetical protein
MRVDRLQNKRLCNFYPKSGRPRRQRTKICFSRNSNKGVVHSLHLVLHKASIYRIDIRRAVKLYGNKMQASVNTRRQS